MAPGRRPAAFLGADRLTGMEQRNLSVVILTLDEERIRYEAEKRAFRMVGRPMEQLRTYGG